MPFSAFDVIGPTMVGPSSSHTAGAVRIGLAARALLGVAPIRATIELHGSFAATGKGHATDRALAAGLLGYAPDDERLEKSLHLAKDAGMALSFTETYLGEDCHPNAARLTVESADGRSHCVTGWSVGGGSILVREIDGFDTRLAGELATLVLWHKDQTGYLAKVTTLYDCAGVNIATIRLSRAARGTTALTTIEADAPLPEAAHSLIAGLSATTDLRALSPGHQTSF